MNLRGKVLSLAAAAAAVPSVVLLVMLARGSGAAEQAIGAKVGEQLRSDIALVQSTIQHVMEVGDDALQRKVSSDLEVARYVMTLKGPAHQHAEETATWTAINQYTKESKQVVLPNFMVGNEWLGQNSSFDSPTAVVDRVQSLVGGTATVFQRLNEEGDMLRVATNVRKLNDTRAIGTYIPAVNPDGKANPVISTIMKGETFRGRAYVVNAWYITAYEPIKDSAGQIIGVLYVGVKQDTVETVATAIASLRIGESGRVSTIPASGRGVGVIAMSGDEKRVGKSVQDFKDTAGEPYLQKVLDDAPKLARGEVGQRVVHHAGANGVAQDILLSYSYFPSWNWVVVSEAHIDEHSQAVEASQAVLSSLLSSSTMLGVLCLLVVIVVAIFLVGTITRPLGSAVHALEEVADGDADLTAQLPTEANDEVGRLGTAFNHFVYKLANTVRTVVTNAGGINQSVLDLRGASESLSHQASEVRAHSATVNRSVQDVAQTLSKSASTSAHAASRMERMSEATRAIAEEVRQIQTQSDDTTASMVAAAAALEEMNSALSEVAHGAAGTANAGLHVGTQADEAMQRMGRLSQAAQKISNVVALIQTIADQTNLLALNATIEAAGAGEAGRGFAVVAGEVKTLASQTANATQEISAEILDIQRNAKETESSIQQVSGGVQKVAALAQQIAATTEQQSSASAEVAENVTRASSAAQTIGETVKTILAGVEEVAADSTTVSSELHDIADTASQIDQAVKEVVGNLTALDTIAVDAAGAADVVKDRAEGIQTQAVALTHEVSRFRTEQPA